MVLNCISATKHTYGPCYITAYDSQGSEVEIGSTAMIWS